MLLLAGIFGAVSAAAGMSLAFVTNSPTGPAMVLVATLLFALSMLLSPKHGVVLQSLRRRRVRHHIDGEDVIKAIFRRAETGEAVVAEDVVRATGLTPRRVHTTLRDLGREGILTQAQSSLLLSPAGQRRANELVRAHRLWESYLAEEVGIPVETIHDEAERLEHVHELADEIDAKLGFPTHDPHGERIPAPEKTASPPSNK
jgi:Mn-dependent DtxR family transcriptional regulator